MKKAQSKVVFQNRDLEMCLRAALEKEGYLLSQERGHGGTGVDIVARKGDELIYIEVIGCKATGPTRSRDFYECFFRTVSRLKDGAERCVMAMHKQAEVGLPARARHYGEAWKRIGAPFPALDIWLVDPEKQSYRPTRWSDWGNQREDIEPWHPRLTATSGDLMFGCLYRMGKKPSRGRD